MPQVIDATVVNSAYTTSASARPQVLSNGWIVAGVWNGELSSASGVFYFYVDKMDGNGFQPLTQINSYTDGFSSIQAKGTDIYLLRAGGTYARSYKFNALDANGSTQAPDLPSYSYTLIDSGQYGAFSGCSLAINEAGTELHASWSSKNSTYPSSFNARYAKATIDSQTGLPTWGSVEQVTKVNSSGNDIKNPVVIVKSDNTPVIIADQNISTSTNRITAWSFNGSTWSANVIYIGDGYTQSSPSALFVPQSVNGLANGWIWVAWHGTDSTDTAVNNIRASYSDDGGVTWSSMQKLTNGNNYGKYVPTITANLSNEIFVLFESNVAGSSYRSVEKIKNSNGVWGNVVEADYREINTPSPSALFDPTFSLNFSEPLFIYKGFAKVGFYGTWTTTEISVTPGHLGEVTDPNALLTYSITTDGTMSTITEKVNGEIIRTVDANSGESLIAGLTQAEWDSVRFGRYADVTGGSNTLTIEMGEESWTYTFDKRPASDADVLSAVKAVKDSQEVYLPSVKAKLASAVRSKGGSVNDADSFEAMVNAVGGIPGKKWASGTSTTRNVTGLAFKPTLIMMYTTNNFQGMYSSSDSINSGFNQGSQVTNLFTVNSSGFSWGSVAAQTTFIWWAFE
jgi:hypothetical protein